MEFRILGPLEVVSEEGPVTVPGAKPRTLLALLLVHANAVVSADRLIEDVWEGSRPLRSEAALQTYVHRLRRALGLESLRTRPGGYVLELKDGDLDALRFQGVVHEVSEAENASPRWVALRLGEALAWWRGRALADFADTAWATPESERLEGLRLGAIEDLIEARLSLGEHGVLVPELESLVSEHPLRERLWGQLMLALYRCDRQVEALRAYQRVRTMLAEELGLEPGPELVELELRILDHDESLTGPAPETVLTARGKEDKPGVGLPSPPTSFIGREDQITEITALVADHCLVTLTGAGGCGKTRLALQVAGRLTNDFADGVRFANLAAVGDEAQVAEAVVAALGLADDPSGTDPPSRLARYLSEREMLCILDNCEHVLDACAIVAQAVISRGGPSRLLATSREPFGIAGEQVYAVPPLGIDTEAVRLFGDRAAEVRAGFVVDDTNQATITEICRGLDGIPLAIELAAARVTHLSPTQLLERLDDRFALLTAQRRIPRHQTLQAALEWSYDLLDPREQEALRCLAVFPASFTLEAAESVTGGDDVVGALGSLVAKSLVETVDSGDRLRYRLLETVRLYAHNRLDTREAESCRTRHRDWVVDLLESIPLEERWFGDGDASGLEYASIRAALDWSHAAGDAEVVARLAAGFNWRASGYPREGVRWCGMALAAAPILPSDLQAQLYLMLAGQAGLVWRGPEDWARIGDWAQRAIAAVVGEPNPLHADALGVRAMALAVKALQRGDQPLAYRAARDADACAAMSEPFSAVRRKYCRLLAGNAHAQLAVAWPRYRETAEGHYAAGIDAAPASAPFFGLHAELQAQLARERFAAGRSSEACALALRARRAVGQSPFIGPHTALALAAIVAVASREHADALQAELRAYHEDARRRDEGPTAAEIVTLFGGMCAAVRDDWELASRLLAAGASSPLRHGIQVSHLYDHVRDRVRAALGPERARQLRDEGRAMALADAVAAALG